MRLLGFKTTANFPQFAGSHCSKQHERVQTCHAGLSRRWKGKSTLCERELISGYLNNLEQPLSPPAGYVTRKRRDLALSVRNRGQVRATPKRRGVKVVDYTPVRMNIRPRKLAAACQRHIRQPRCKANSKRACRPSNILIQPPILPVREATIPSRYTSYATLRETSR